jgi:exodeoxyribonuclease VII small subunit
MAKDSKQDDYQQLSRRLDEVVEAIQGPDVTIDQAIAAYEEGMELITKLQVYLKSAENRITKLQAQKES